MREWDPDRFFCPSLILKDAHSGDFACACVQGVVIGQEAVYILDDGYEDGIS
jgi:hypothetical protein